jgi:hypothetical protein
MIGPFEFIYRWFVSWYGADLADHLAGAICDDGNVIFPPDGKNLYTPIGIVALAIALVIFVVYYYIVNSASLNKWWHWLIVMLFIGIINLFIGYDWTYSELPNVATDCLPNVSETDCWLFGLANFFISILLFIIFSIAFKWGSRNCRRTPF